MMAMQLTVARNAGYTEMIITMTRTADLYATVKGVDIIPQMTRTDS